MTKCDRCGKIDKPSPDLFVPIGNNVLCFECNEKFKDEFMPRWKRGVDNQWKQFHELLAEFIGKKVFIFR